MATQLRRGAVEAAGPMTITVMNGAVSADQICRLVDFELPLTHVKETTGEWQLGRISVSRLNTSFRCDETGRLTETSCLRKQAFGPTEGGRRGIAVIFREFDRSPQQTTPREHFAGWVPAERERSLDRWIEFLHGEIADRRRGIASRQAYATYKLGEAVTVELYLQGRVRLVHARRGVRRGWSARALPELWPALTAALAAAAFPAPPDAEDGEEFELSVNRDGRTSSVRGAASASYRDVSRLFADLIGQLSRDEVLGFEPEIRTRFVVDPIADEA
ncbi:MAG: hypothetical protein WKG01_25670 [Kofleriaceae bacterium]